MAENLSFGQFAMIPIASENDWNRPGTLIWEYFQVDVTINTNTGDVEIPTALGDVIGVVPLNFSSVFDTGDAVTNYTTDGVITTGAVTVRVNSVSIADGALTIRGFLIGHKSTTVITLG